MRMFDFFKRFGSKPETKASQGDIIFGDKHESTLLNAEAYSKEGYGQNPTVFRCVDLISKCAGAIRLQVAVNGERVEDHPLQKLLDRPNPDQGGVEYRTEAFMWVVLQGTSFQERINSGLDGRPIQLWNWQPYSMTIDHKAGDRMPSRYVFNKYGDGSKSWDVDVVTGESDMLLWRTANPMPNASSRGLSPMAPGASSVDSYNLAMAWRKNNMKNGGSPKHLVSFESGSQVNTKEVERKLAERYSGPSGKRFMVAAGGKMDIKALENSMRDAEWLNGTKLNKQEICEVFGVPAQLLGIEGSQTFANYAEAREAFYLDTVIPWTELYISELNRWLADSFEDGAKVCYTPDTIDALEGRRLAKREQILQSNVFTINEKRALFDYEANPDPEADVLFVDPSLLPLGMDVMDLQTEEATKGLQRLGLDRQEAETKAQEILAERSKLAR